MNNDNSQNHDDEIDFKEIFLILWNKKLLIIAITTIAAVISISYALSLPNIYSSKALLAPTAADESLNSKLSSYSSIAGLAGISLPANTGSKSAEAIERIKSYDFFVNLFVPNIKFENLVAVNRWIQVNNTIAYDESIFDKTKNEWVREIQYPMLAKPSNQEAYEVYSQILTISENKKNSFITISIEHHSPFIAEKWLNLIIQNINHHMRELDKNIAKNSIDFLNISAQNTNLSEIKVAISKLVENQIQTLTLAEANKDYVFKPISSPIAPEKKSKPSRAFICILGTIFGLIFSVFLSFMLHFFTFKKS